MALRCTARYCVLTDHLAHTPPGGSCWEATLHRFESTTRGTAENTEGTEDTEAWRSNAGSSSSTGQEETPTSWRQHREAAAGRDRRRPKKAKAGKEKSTLLQVLGFIVELIFEVLAG